MRVGLEILGSFSESNRVSEEQSIRGGETSRLLSVFFFSFRYDLIYDACTIWFSVDRERKREKGEGERLCYHSYP